MQVQKIQYNNYNNYNNYNKYNTSFGEKLKFSKALRQHLLQNATKDEKSTLAFYIRNFPRNGLSGTIKYNMKDFTNIGNLIERIADKYSESEAMRVAERNIQDAFGPEQWLNKILN